jgi:alpha-beta hydrolase superfamily lysophospholipase
MASAEPLTTYLELRESTAGGEQGAGLSHRSEGLVLLHVLEIASFGEPRGGVTLLHDAGDHGGRYVDFANVLAQGGWAVALPDMRGHGRSEGERGHSAGLKEVLRDVQSVQDHLAYRLPDAPKTLIGQGLGALYALAYALENPDQSAALVLLSPRWNPVFEQPRPAKGLLKVFKKIGPTTPGRIGLTAEELTGDEAQRAAWSSDELVHDVISVRAAEQAGEIARAHRPRLGELSIPRLVLHGSEDRVADPAASRELEGAAEVRILEGRAHDLLHEHGADELASEIRTWLESAV